MTERDPLESFEQALFRAARRERTRTRALERTATALVATHRRRRVQRSLFALAATVALAAALALVLRNGPSAESIEAERIVPKHAVSSVVGAPSISAPRAVASDDAETLQDVRREHQDGQAQRRDAMSELDRLRGEMAGAVRQLGEAKSA